LTESGTSGKRLEIPYWEGINSLVSFSVSKKTELFHSENARSISVGSIEKRKGQTTLGTQAGGAPFITTNNSGLLFFRQTHKQHQSRPIPPQQ
jgi:hypothetical protein